MKDFINAHTLVPATFFFFRKSISKHSPHHWGGYGCELSYIKSQDSEWGNQLKETVAKVTCHSPWARVGLTGLYQQSAMLRLTMEMRQSRINWACLMPLATSAFMVLIPSGHPREPQCVDLMLSGLHFLRCSAFSLPPPPLTEMALGPLLNCSLNLSFLTLLSTEQSHPG